MSTDSRETYLAVGVGRKSDPRRWMALIVLLFAAVLDLVDVTIVNVALPTIQRDLGASYEAVQWVLAGYTLAFALGLITGGRLGDIYGRKRVFLVGVAGFALGSTLCGLAPTPEVLVASRVLQGAMAAVMIPQVVSIIQATFPPGQRGAAFGAYGAVAGLASAAGPLIGGLLIRADLMGLGWRPIFLVNVPVGLFALIAAALVVRESRSEHPLRLDLAGVAIVTVGLLLLVFPLVEGRNLGWPAWTFASMGASVPILAAFALWERHKAVKDGSPLVPPGLFGERAFVAGLLVNLIFFLGVGSFFLVLALHLQIGLGFTPLHAGLTILPFSLGGVVASGISVQLAPKVGRRVLAAGALLMAMGMAGLIFAFSLFGTETGTWKMLPALLVAGFGMGLILPPLADVILAGVPSDDAGAASGVLSSTNQLGNAVGVAIAGVIFFGLLASQASASAAAVAPQIRADLERAGMPASVQGRIVREFETCFQDRASEKDPSAVPPSCRPAEKSGAQGRILPGTERRMEHAIASAADSARERDFTTSIERTLRWEVGAFVAVFFLTFFLPEKPRPETPERPSNRVKEGARR
ncbi:MAG: MFS transporter [Actinomycetota bacterium]|nr:MFS transporter [Actinomycetota bacterium]